jgi:hypothetical protein
MLRMAENRSAKLRGIASREDTVQLGDRKRYGRSKFHGVGNSHRV